MSNPVRALPLLIALFCGFALAQADSKVLTNQSVIDMVQQKLPAEVIVTKIQTSRSNFDVSTAGLVALNKAGVPPEVVKAMMVIPVDAQAGDPSDPLTKHAPGVYVYYKSSGGKQQLVELEPTAYTANKESGSFLMGMTYGLAKMKQKAAVQGPHAAVRTTDSDAVFYFYFDETGSAFNQSLMPYTSAVSSPNQFTLLRFDVKRNSRELVVMEGNEFGSQTGTQENASVPFNFEKIRSGVYKVTPNAPLRPGEYCFLSSQFGGAFGAAGAAFPSQVFDFGIIPAQ
jgi:hypothetical protein